MDGSYVESPVCCRDRDDSGAGYRTEEKAVKNLRASGRGALA